MYVLASELIPGVADQIFPQLVQGAVPGADRGEGRGGEVPEVDGSGGGSEGARGGEAQ